MRVPLDEDAGIELTPPPLGEPPHLVNEVGDDRGVVGSGDRVVLIVENDLAFARFLLDTVRERGFKGIVTSEGVAALALASQYNPAAITLDLFLPDINGWRVLSRLKNDSATRHIPVTVISTDESRDRALAAGAFHFVAKPIQGKEILDALLEKLDEFTRRAERRLLLASADSKTLEWLAQHFAADDLHVLSAADWNAACAMIASERFDCAVIDAQLDVTPANGNAAIADGDAFDRLPILFFGDTHPATGQNGARARIRGTLVKDVHSSDRLLEQASFFLHRDFAKMPESHRKILRKIYDADDILRGKRVMIVDDDMRNIFALSSLLEERGMTVLSHDNGRDAISHLQRSSDIDIVLMDIMMPEIDGIDTIREVRKIEACRSLPIIAVTAKAMKGDREKCMEAGAWDYLSKPVDSELLLSVLRAWL